MEQTIYKPSIYKGAGIYKTGAGDGGGGGGDIPGHIEGIKLFNQMRGVGTYFRSDNFDSVFSVAYTDKVHLNITFNKNVGSSYNAFRINRTGWYYNACNTSIGIADNLFNVGVTNFNRWGASVNILSGQSATDDYNIDFVIKESKAYYNGQEFNINSDNAGSGPCNEFRPIGMSGMGVFNFMKVYDNEDKLKYHIRPAIDTQQNKKGIYDLVIQTFYPESQGNCIYEYPLS